MEIPPISTLELKLTQLIANKLSFAKLDAFMITLSDPYRWLLPLLNLAMILIYLDWQSGVGALLLGALSASVADGFNTRVIKRNTNRLRPGKRYDNIRLLGIMNAGKKSFPSNHASNTMAIAVAFSFIFGWATWVLIPLSILVGYSRIYCGAHYPLDVFAGWVFGATWSVIIYGAIQVFIN